LYTRVSHAGHPPERQRQALHAVRPAGRNERRAVPLHRLRGAGTRRGPLSGRPDHQHVGAAMLDHVTTKPEETLTTAPGTDGDTHQQRAPAILRTEDLRLLRGDGYYVDADPPSRVLEMAVARCRFPQARIVSIDISEAMQLPGVRHILCPEDIADATHPMTVLRPVPGAAALPYYALAQGRALHEGQPVISIAAPTRAIAEDAIELVHIEYEPLPCITDTAKTIEPEALILHPDILASHILAENVDQAGEAHRKLGEADVVVRGRFRVNRVTPLPM